MDFLELVKRLPEMEDSCHQVSLTEAGIVFLCLYFQSLWGRGMMVTKQV